MARFDADRLRTQLKLAKCRLENLLKQHRNMSGGRRQEIAHLLAQGQEERARVKYLIRDDYLMEAYELLLACCDDLTQSCTLLAREKTVEADLLMPCKSIIYAAARLDIPELGRVRDQLVTRLGREVADVNSEVGRTSVDPRLVVKLSIRTPDTKLANQYMAAIAQIFSVPWSPPAETETETALGVSEDVLIASQGSSIETQTHSLSPTASTSPTATATATATASTSPSLSTSPTHAAAPFDEQPPSYSAAIAALHASHTSRTPTPTLTSPNASSVIPDFDELQRRFQALKRS